MKAPGSVGWMLVALTLLGSAFGCGRLTRTPHAHAQPSTMADLFRDVSGPAGIQFVLGHGEKSPLTILETLGSGCAFLDYDGDGWLDILLVGPDKVALYHNNRDGTFRDVTAGSGLRQQGYWQGIATGDYDNDGKMDVFITGYRCCALYHNEGAGKFRDVTREAGVASNLWGASACFVDVDNDGYLDLFVTHYVKFYPTSVQFCNFNGMQSTCGPTTYDPEKSTLYHNDGHGKFSDETVKRGLADAHGNALGVAIADYNGDGWIDIAVADDQLPGDLFRNKGRGYFENVGLTSGTAYDAGGNAHAGMGIDWADLNADGKLALVVTTYQHQPTSLYVQAAPGMFSDVAYAARIGQATVNTVGFGVKFFEYDNDGLPDLVIANGHAVDRIARQDHTTSYRQVPQLFHNIGDGKLEEVTSEAGAAFRRPIVGRGLAVGDFDNDGREDLLIVDIEGHALLLHNEVSTPHHWLSLRLQGTKSNRDGIGAQIFVEAGGRKWQQVVTTGGSFMSASDIRAHLGLGAAKRADRITVRWPSGYRTVLRNVGCDQFLTITEGQDTGVSARK